MANGKFGGGPEWPQPAQPEQQLPPSLLQLAQGVAPQGAGGGFVGGEPGVLQGYYGSTSGGRAPQIDDASQAAEQGGTTLQGLAAGFFPQQLAGGQGYRIPSDQGGFFNIEDLFRQLGRDIPRTGTYNSSGPSTNNWRLLGMGPGWIMRNGSLIDTRSNGARWGGPASFTPSGGSSGEQSMPARGTALGAGVAFGVPNMLQAGLGQPVGYGWPGATQWDTEGGTWGMST